MINRFMAWLTPLRDAGLIEAEDVRTATEQFMALVRSGLFLRISLSVPPAASEAEIVSTVRVATDTWLRAYAPRR
jgi:hypothetical protein